MTSRKRLWLFFLGMSILAMVLLAAGLSDLEFLPGQPLPQRAQPTETPQLFSGSIPGRQILGLLLTIAYFVGILLLPFAIVYVIVSPDARRRVVRSLGLLLWLAALSFLIRARPELFEELPLQPLALPPTEGVETAMVEFAAGFPPWVVWLTTLGLAVLVAAGLVGGLWLVWRRRRPQVDPRARLSEEARLAVDALEAGADLKDTVTRCYFEMGRVLSEQRGIRREEAMTPREFEHHLKRVGLPDRHVEQLTRLFERVRYGAKVADEREEREAVACLTAIIEVCANSP